MPSVTLRLAAALSLARAAAGHGSMVTPPPRNAVEKSISPWNGTAPAQWNHHVDTKICPTSSGESVTGLSLRNGQSCFWFSHGCTIYCDKCDGKTARAPHKGACGNEGKVKATICDPKLRTININAPCGDESDYYYYNPWRAPGSAPVFDACGMAGGAPVPAGWPDAGVGFTNTVFAKEGDLGSKTLPPSPSGTVWTAGELAEVSWTVRTNHGGGYQYRLCSADGDLTEQCFQKMALPFEGRSSLRWGGKGGKQMWFNGTYVSEGTVPAGSTWAKNPIPRIDATKYGYTGQQSCFPAPCYEPNPPASGGWGGACSGWYGPDNLEIVDTVRVPADLPPGKYVVGWRLDCEESAQIWQNCADVTVVAK